MESIENPFIEQRLVPFVAQAVRDLQRPVRTGEIAAQLAIAYSTCKRYIKWALQKGLLIREGIRRGYRPAPRGLPKPEPVWTPCTVQPLLFAGLAA